MHFSSKKSENVNSRGDGGALDTLWNGNSRDVGQGLEGYSRDPGFGQNTVRDLGKRKIS